MTQLYSTQREPSVPFVYEIHFWEWVLITLTQKRMYIKFSRHFLTTVSISVHTILIVSWLSSDIKLSLRAFRKTLQFS